LTTESKTAHASPRRRPPVIWAPRLSGQGRSFGWLAENPAAAFAETGPLPVHAGRDPVHVRNFRRAEPENIGAAKPPLILLGEGVARPRQYRQSENQAGNELEILAFEPNNPHRCPQNSTAVTAIRQAVCRLGINHDGIEARAGISRFSNKCAPVFAMAGCICVLAPKTRRFLTFCLPKRPGNPAFCASITQLLLTMLCSAAGTNLAAAAYRAI
jgi:hypothetical protein